MFISRWRSLSRTTDNPARHRRLGDSDLGQPNASDSDLPPDAATWIAGSGADAQGASELQWAIRAAQREAQARHDTRDDERASIRRILDDDLEFMRSALTGYEILERIGCGGQGIVYRARHRMTQRIVTIKVLLDGPLATPRQLARFEREAELTSRLQHPNIVTLYDYGVVRGRPYLVIQHVEGLPINEHVILHDLPPRDVVALFVKVCRAVGHAHQQGIIHRDLSPANILVDALGEPHVLDFGMAKSLLHDDPPTAACSTQGLVVGTLPYLSPEQAAGAGGVDVRSDIYSLGVVLYELLTDILPYSAEGDAQRVRDAIQSAEPLSLRAAAAAGDLDRLPRPEAITRDLEAIVHKALAKDKAERYQSAAALADDLDRYLAGEPVDARAASRFYLLRKTLRRYRFAATIATLLFVVLATATGVVGMSLVHARVQRDTARATASVAHAALSDVVTEIETEIRTLAGGIEVRDRLVQRVAGHLEQLRPLAETDAAMWDVLAALREKQGDIGHAQGRGREAAEHYQAALGVLTSHADVPAPSVDILAQTARLHRKLAPLSDQPELHLEQAVTLGERLLREYPASADLRYELASARLAAGLHFHSNGHPERAVGQIDAALALAEDHASADADRVRWDDLLATAQATRGTLDMKLGRRPSAVRYLELAVHRRESLVAARPADVLLRHKLVVELLQLGHLQRDGGQRESAESLYRRAVEAGEYLVMADPGAALWMHDLYVAHDALARLLLRHGCDDEARQHGDRAVELAAGLVAIEPDQPGHRRLLGFSHKLRGQIHAARTEWRSALESFEQSLAIRAAMQAQEPANLEYQADLAEIHDWIGKCCRNLGESEAALAHYRAAYEIRTTLLAAQPDAVDRAVDVLLSQTKLATWHLDRNTSEDDEAASQLLAKAETTLRHLGSAGRILLETGKYRGWLDAVQANRTLIQERRLARAGEGTTPGSQGSPP